MFKKSTHVKESVTKSELNLTEREEKKKKIQTLPRKSSKSIFGSIQFSISNHLFIYFFPEILFL